MQRTACALLAYGDGCRGQAHDIKGSKFEQRGTGRCRSQGVNLGTVPAYLDADAPRVGCAEPRGDGGGGTVGVLCT